MAARFRNLFLNLLALTPSIVFACSSLEPPPTDDAHFHKASAVFVAHITKTEEVILSLGDKPTLVPSAEGTFRIIEILKGTPPDDGKIQTSIFSPHSCSGVALLAGYDYLLFLRGDKWVYWSTGSRPIIPGDSESTRLLETLRKLRDAR